MLKIKSLKEIIEPIANKRGISFEDYLELITEDQRFEMMMDQLLKYSKRKGVRTDSKLKKLPNKHEFKKICLDHFCLKPTKNQIQKYSEFIHTLFNEYSKNTNKSLRFTYQDSSVSTLKDKEVERAAILAKDFNFPLETWNITKNDKLEIDKLAVKILDRNNPQSYSTHYKKHNAGLCPIASLFHCIRVDSTYYYRDLGLDSHSVTYSKISHVLDLSDLSKGVNNAIKKVKERKKIGFFERTKQPIPKDWDFDFGIDYWGNTSSYDMKITNIEELKLACIVFRKYMNKLEEHAKIKIT